ncbi:MAG: enoyl-CoA hydratase-related protein [SAR202 cluster bacterium]|jgi:enoyl-CoA hydratase/carnithine racemase|nr:enoyl-CoA hydratase-related protein [SAR202 cluster bacterium]MDP6511696.1 enoyl-CoA hydratase-related protein [SAR202 cluster bacterium]
MTGEQSNAISNPNRPTLPPLEEREWKHVLWNVSDSGVLSITLDRPQRLNALNYRLLRELHQLIEHAHETPEIRVVTIRGQGTRAFCSGDDLNGMEPEPGVDNSRTVHHQILNAIRDLPKPVVALIHGFALGHGFELACACDLRLGSDNIEIGDHRVLRAIGPNGGSTWYLPRIVGHGRALELLMTGRHLNSQEAFDWGWLNHTWAMDEFEERAAEYVETLAQLPTIAAGVFKSAMEYSVAHGYRDSLAYELEVTLRNLGTYDANEGRVSFHEKRDGVYKGR